MNRTSAGSTILQELVAEIASDSDACKWFVSSQTIADILKITKEEYYRKYYHFKTDHPKSSGIKGFSENEIDLLISFLNQLLPGENIEKAFREYGIYFDEESKHDLLELFKRLVEESLNTHKLDKELLLLLASSTRNFDDSIDSYLLSKFDRELFIQKTVAVYIQSNNIFTENNSDFYLTNFLEDYLSRRPKIWVKITEEFRERSYYDLYGKFREKRKKKVRKTSSNPEIKALLEFFDLELEFSLDDLKKNFKALLKKYHPDVNKNGLEMTQTIIKNYNKLLEFRKRELR